MPNVDEPAIQTHQLSHRFPLQGVLKNLSMEIPKGSICGLLGPNGGGKTTLMRILIGTLHPSKGSSRVLGLDPLQDAEEIRRRVGYMPQTPDYPPQMTVQQTINFIRPFYKGRWNDEELQRQMERFHLKKWRNSEIETLSVGMLRRLMLAMTLAPQPELLLLDEPTAGLDAMVRRDFAEAVVEYMSVPGRTVILSSHLLSELERLVDCVVFLKPWKPAVAASLEDLKENLVRLEVQPAEEMETLELPEGVTPVSNFRRGDTHIVSIWNDGSGVVEQVRQHLQGMGSRVHTVSEASLDSIFVDLMEY